MYLLNFSFLIVIVITYRCKSSDTGLFTSGPVVICFIEFIKRVEEKR